MNVKRKGSAGERELCEYLTAAGFPAHRNEQRYDGGYNNPDVSAEGLEALHIECKRVEKLNVNEAMRQAAADAAKFAADSAKSDSDTDKPDNP